MNLKSLLVKFHADEDGVTATEYLVLLVLIGVAGLATMKLFGTNFQKTFAGPEGRNRSKPKF
jgi:Flp pilus assembly pilin Flp